MKVEEQSLNEPQKPQLNIGVVSGSLYPSEDDIMKMVEDFTKDLNVSNTTKRATQFGYQEGLYKMIEIWKQSNNDR